MKDEMVECPCYAICVGLGIQVGRWCRFRPSELPHPGVTEFRPESTRCPPGLQATVLLLGHMLADGDNRALSQKLGQVRNWVKSIRDRQDGSYQPVRDTPAAERDRSIDRET